MSRLNGTACAGGDDSGNGILVLFRGQFGTLFDDDG